MFDTLERRMLLAVTQDATFPTVSALPTTGAFDEDAVGIVGFLQVLDDDKIVTGGSISTNTTVQRQLRVARFDADGQLDPTFGGGDGLSAAVDVPDSGRVATRGAVQSDGKVLLATTTEDGFAVVRFNADGSTDTTFGGVDGVAVIGGFGNPTNTDVHNPSVALTTDGDIVVIGSSAQVENALFYAARLNGDGTLDTGFGDGGRLTIDPDDIEAGFTMARAHDVAALAGGKVVILVELGTPQESNRKPALMQLDAAGDFDTSFSGDGKLPFEFDVDENGDEAGALLVQGDGKIVVVGSTQTGTNSTAITRFNANGTVDGAFGTNGVGRAAPPFQREPYDITTDSDGNFIVTLSTEISRFTPDGDPDTQFAPGGTAETDFGGLFPFDLDSQDRAIVNTGGQLARLFLSDEDRPDVELGTNGTLIVTGESGTADNTITIALSADDIVVTRNGVATSFDADAVADIDIVTFDGDDTITVSVDRPVKLRTGDGANDITLADGNHTITGGGGVDDITAGDGNHVVVSGGGNDVVVLGTGRTTVLGGDGNDTITTGGGNDEIQGEAGSDSISSGGGDDIVFGGIAIGEFRGAGGADGDNVIDGGDGNDFLVGADGRDTIRGGAQKDIIIGFNHSDLLIGGGGKDKIAGGGGRDRIRGGGGNDQLDGGDGDDRVAGGAGDDKVFGGAGLDQLNGDDGDDLFFAQDDAIDQIDGGAGENTAVEFDDEDEIVNAVEGV